MYLRTLKILLSLGLALFLAPAYSQLPVVNFEVINLKDGLPGNTILSATRDHVGFMWFGTRQNVVRYNGSTFQRYDVPETNFVTGIGADRDNNIWLSSDLNGVCRIDANTLQMEGMPVTPQADIETTGFFFIDKYNNGWYSDRQGVNRMNLKTRQRYHYRFRKTMYVGTKASFTEDSKGNLWVIGKDNGLFKYDRERDVMQCMWGWDNDKKAPSEPILLASACAGRDGVLWIGSFNLGLIRYDPSSNAIEYFRTGRRTNQINSVTPGVDENGKAILWVGDSEGLGIFRPDQKRFYFFDKILQNPYTVNYIYRDKVNGIVWVCTTDGIIKYNPVSNVIRTLMLPQNVVELPVTINVIREDERDSSVVYLGLSHTGVLRWNKAANTFTLIRYPATSAETRWIHQQDGRLWLGTNRWDYERPGIFVYDLNAGKFINTPLSDAVNRSYSVPFFMYGGFDISHRLWIGNSDEGIQAFDSRANASLPFWPKAVQQKFLSNNNLINDMLIYNDSIWLGTMQGVYVADKETSQFVKVDPEWNDKVQAESVNTLLRDRHGALWAARWGSLTKMEKAGSFSRILTTQDGFVDRQIQGLAEDNSGNIWAGNYEGLYCYLTSSGHLKRFTTNDGLMNNNTAGALAISKNGKHLYVGQQNGLNIIDVGCLVKLPEHAAIGITSFKVHEKEKHVDLHQTVALTPQEKALSVDFIALNYNKHHDNVYAYYLEGFEKTWNYSGPNHVAYYTNLNPGTYTLHMKAGDVLGNWNPQISTIRINVLPAFYETLWFKFLIVILFSAFLYGLYRYRINQLLRLQHVRNRISADLHDELGSSLSGISIMGTLAKGGMAADHPSVSFIDRMMEEVRQISGSLDDIVWNISPRNDSLSSLIARMTRYASEVFEARKIHYNFSMPQDFEQITLSMEQRRNFYLIFKESINNLIKHSQCTSTTVVVSIDRKKINMLIQDDGKGFNPDVIHERNGLENMKARAASLKGRLIILSTPGKGTEMKLEFPL